MLVTSVASFHKYQQESAWIWEHQALTRARFCAGDATVGAAFERERRAVLSMSRELPALRGEIAGMRKKLHDAHPNPSGQFDLKHDQGGMIDIEFSVQYLVLAYAAIHPQLLDDLGNIALLRLAGEAGLLDVTLARQAGDAYRAYRKRQHALRLTDARFARVPAGELVAERATVSALWSVLFAG
jgi:glutamate-ammonia-ligase adenylyltransferase